jgi:hypothetical protein
VAANIEFKDSAELNSALESLALASKKTLKEVIPPQVRLFATDLAANTRPFGKDAGSQKDGQEKIGARIGEIYKPVGFVVEHIREKFGKNYASSFIRCIKTKNYAGAETLLRAVIPGSRSTIGEWDGGKLHAEQKNQKKVSKTLVVVGDFRAVERYAKETKRLVGFAKGGFATAARELGGVRGIPGYATRQNSPGRGIIQEDGNGLTVTLENNVRYIEHAYDAHSESRAIDFRIKQINSVIKRIGDRNLKSASRHVK